MTKRIFIYLFLWSVGYSLFAQRTLDENAALNLFNEGEALFEAKNYAGAQQSFKQFLQVSAESSTLIPEAKYYIAYCAVALFHGSGQQLMEDFLSQYADHPKAKLAAFQMGNFWYQQKQYESAIAYYKKVDSKALSNKQQNEWNFKWGYSLFYKKQFKDALRQFARVNQGQFGPAAAYYIGYIYVQNQQFDKAIEAYDRAEASPTYQHIVPYLKSNVYYKLKAFQKVIDYGSSALERDQVQQKESLKLLIADSHYQLGDYEAACVQFDRLDVNAKRHRVVTSPQIHYNMGFAYYKCGEFDAAIPHFEKIASKKEQMGQVSAYYLGIMYLQKDQESYAIASLQQAANQEFDLSIMQEATFLLAKAYLTKDNISQGIEMMQRYLAFNTELQHRNEGQELLGQAFMVSQDYDLAIDYLNKLTSKNRAISKVHQKLLFGKGSQLFNEAKFKESIPYFKDAIALNLDPNITAQANFWVGEAYSIGKKYKEAILFYKPVIRSANNLEIASKAHYGLGVAYFNLKSYSESLHYFSKYINAVTANEIQHVDAYLRMGDCHFVQKKFDQAIKCYDLAIEQDAEKDYALFQKGSIYYLIGETNYAIENFDNVLNEFPSSIYLDDALFQKAQVLFEQGSYSKAIEQFQRLIKQKPNSPFLPTAYLRLGIAHFNLKSYDQAKGNYEVILNRYMDSPVASAALLGLQEVLQELGKPNEFNAYLAAYKSHNPNDQAVAEIAFNNIKSIYFDEDYELAINRLDDFIKTYTNPILLKEANYYKAESFYRLGRLGEALPLYEEISRDQSHPNIYRIRQRLADISFENKSFKKAVYYYSMLAQMAKSKKQLYKAWNGLMQSHYELEHYDSTSYFAHAIIENAKVNADAESRARLFIGKSYYKTSRFDSANYYFDQTIELAKDIHAAEAQYIKAEGFFQNGDYQQSLDYLFELNNQYAVFEYWIGQSFLLISENYTKVNKKFQAKATLQSLIDHSPLSQVVEEAKLRLARLEKEDQQPNTEDTTTHFD